MSRAGEEDGASRAGEEGGEEGFGTLKLILLH